MSLPRSEDNPSVYLLDGGFLPQITFERLRDSPLLSIRVIPKTMVSKPLDVFPDFVWSEAKITGNNFYSARKACIDLARLQVRRKRELRKR